MHIQNAAGRLGLWSVSPLSIGELCLVPEVSQYLRMHLGSSDSQYDDEVL